MDPAAVEASEAAMAELLKEEEAEAAKKGAKKQKAKAKKKMNSKAKVPPDPFEFARFQRHN